MHTYLFTGFPGFIARNLVKGIIESPRHQVEAVYLLVLPSQKEHAEAEVTAIENIYPETAGRLHLVTGDITDPHLGLEKNISEYLASSVNFIFHLAALYDLAADAKAARKVNVTGTENVTRWTSKCTALIRYVYFSTAYVSGKREGLVLETELDAGQSFKNHYEQTKFEAEKIVEAHKGSIPITIIRPGIVRGHSVTGETIKFDGPYFILNMFDRLSFLPALPYLGAGEADGNFVPVDYVIQASVYLSTLPQASGNTFHLTDPSPLRMREIYRLLMEEYLGKKPAGTIPFKSATAFLHFRPLRQWLGIEREALDYLICRTNYDTSNTERALENSGIRFSSFQETLPAMVSFYKNHRKDPEKKVKIN
ncbi:SDR family oxidoreductase [Alteribacter natronophilus]|uniref:SDR family oxidoreductase n=1 Tax=Alteribacter natronophilus TaxID=2583810 RepID=UPI00110E716A|nr:SDR family oxidoreductase [Alteribacter natronophilus]TMW73483.1 SDR family oxidoreductase [Alteribacter natronophilus]